MNTCVIIAEYNPFHNGHAWQIAHARELGAKNVVVIMSGNFVERGTPALFPKQCRTAAALCCGADMVIELPCAYAVSGAEKFATSAVKLANALGFADSLVFGAETADIAQLIDIAQLLLTPKCDALIKGQLTEGNSYAVARGLACEYLRPGSAEVLVQPNNILAIEYCKALITTNSDLIPFAFPRMGVDHDDQKATDEFASASFLRGLKPEAWHGLVPTRAQIMYSAETIRGNIIDFKRFELSALSRLRCATPGSLALLPDISEGLENAIYNAIQTATALEDVYGGAKSKRYAHSRIRRIVLNSVLGISKALPADPPYIRVLGANENGFKLIGENKEKIKLPYSHSIAELEKKNINCAAIASAEVRSGDFYGLCLAKPIACGAEYHYQIVKSI